MILQCSRFSRRCCWGTKCCRRKLRLRRQHRSCRREISGAGHLRVDNERDHRPLARATAPLSRSSAFDEERHLERGCFRAHMTRPVSVRPLGWTSSTPWCRRECPGRCSLATHIPLLCLSGAWKRGCRLPLPGGRKVDWAGPHSFMRGRHRGRHLAPALVRTGLPGRRARLTQTTVSARTVAKLGTVSLPPAERGLPSRSRHQEEFPKGGRIPIHAVFQVFRGGETHRGSSAQHTKSGAPGPPLVWPPP